MLADPTCANLTTDTDTPHKSLVEAKKPIFLLTNHNF